MSSLEKLIENFLRNGINETLVRKLIEEYKEVKKQHYLGDVEKVILHSAKFSDLTLAFIKSFVEKTDVNLDNLHFDKLFEEVRNYRKETALQVIFTLAIPRVAQSVYTIRSKKDVAHVKTIDPDLFDASYCVSACDWMLSQFISMFYTSDLNEANNLILSLGEKKIPIIEEFEDGTIAVLKNDSTLDELFLFTLYHCYPKRLSLEDLAHKTRYENRKYMQMKLKELDSRNLIHLNEEGAKLTKKGIKFVDESILRRSEDS